MTRPKPTHQGAQPPPTGNLEVLAEAAKCCQACPLWRTATQTVFGSGDPHPRVMFVGEQPGDQEDKRGLPFVGPAGGLLHAAMESAGLDPAQIYTTNVVKHFKWEPVGHSRLHKKPTAREVQACLPWLESEILAIDPEVIVCLGATATQALLGRAFRIGEHRGQFFPGPSGRTCFVTVHPSSILRAPDSDARHDALADFTRDLRLVARHLAANPAQRVSLR